MLKTFKRLKKNGVPTLIVLALCALSLWYYLKASDSIQMQTQVVQHDHVEAKALKNDSKKASEKNKVQTSQEESLAQEEEKFSYQREAQKVKELKEQLPASKSQLLEIVVRKDIYKNEKVVVRAHTKTEITQNQMGAIKVLALRALMARDVDSDTIKSDLDYVIQKAQDPTIIKIAKAARESIDKGRSFFDDFPDGISNM